MVRILAIMALASTALALDVKFRRYADKWCSDDKHIRKDTHLHNPWCKTFSLNEVSFESFKITVEDDKSDLFNYVCDATAFEEPDCQGKSWSSTSKCSCFGSLRQPT